VIDVAVSLTPWQAVLVVFIASLAWNLGAVSERAAEAVYNSLKARRRRRRKAMSGTDKGDRA